MDQSCGAVKKLADRKVYKHLLKRPKGHLWPMTKACGFMRNVKQLRSAAGTYLREATRARCQAGIHRPDAVWMTVDVACQDTKKVADGGIGGFVILNNRADFFAWGGHG